MQKMPSLARPSMLRKVLDDRFSLLSEELVALFEQEVAAREAETRRSARDDMAQSLNQAVRILRQADDFAQMSAVLSDSSATYCNLLAVFSINGEIVRGERVKGIGEEGQQQFHALEFPLTQAAAFASAIESRDTVVAMTTPREISAPLGEIFRQNADDRACILPIVVRQKAIGLIYASGAVEMAPLELLAQAAGLAAEVRQPPEPAKKSELVVIQGGRPEPRKIPASWGELTVPDQEIHLRAQRFARVQVAGMRLFSPELVRQGRASKDLYGALQKDIDAGREMFRQMFLTASPTMLDYFHLELMRTLANDDARLLGEKYPGPLV